MIVFLVTFRCSVEVRMRQTVEFNQVGVEKEGRKEVILLLDHGI